MLYNFLLLTFLSFAQALPFNKEFYQCKNINNIYRKQCNMILPVFETNLEGIITARAFTSSLITNLRNEVSGDKIFLQLSYPHMDSFVYISISLFVLYTNWKIHENDSQRISKFQKIDEFKKKEKVVKNIIFIILFLFTKDVLPAA